jgi:tetratricopeptide (TPR) repeat protein
MFTAAVPLHQGMVTLHESYPTEFRSYYIPSSDYLRIASLGQRNFWADLIFIWSVQFFDRYAESVRDTYLFHTFQVITDLDPRFTEAYIFGNLFLSLDRRYDLIYQLSDKGLAKNPKDWILAWDAGTYAFFQEKNYSQALKYFLLAEERNPDNTLVQDLLANSYKYRGDYESSLRYWQGILEKYKDVDTERGHFFAFAAARNIFDLTIKIDLQKLTVAVESYRKAHGSTPPNLRTLAGEGFLKVIPVDPEGKAYLYDPVTGEVSCQTPFKFRGKYAQW